MPKVRKSLFDANYVEIVDGLIQRRKLIGLSQWDMAVRLGEDQSWVSRVERKQRRLDAFEYVRFCRVLDLEPGEILNPIWERLPRGEDRRASDEA